MACALASSGRARPACSSAAARSAGPSGSKRSVRQRERIVGRSPESRLALFWTLLATTPAWLLHGLVRGFIGPGPAEQLVGAGLLLAFVTIWGICLREAEIAPETEAAT